MLRLVRRLHVLGRGRALDVGAIPIPLVDLHVVVVHREVKVPQGQALPAVVVAEDGQPFL